MNEEIINRVAGSGLVSLDIEEYLIQRDKAQIDLKDFLFQGIILKESHFIDVGRYA